MVNHSQNRAALLKMIDAMPFDRRKGKSFPLSEQDYVGFPLPRNLQAAPHGDYLANRKTSFIESVPALPTVIHTVRIE